MIWLNRKKTKKVARTGTSNASARRSPRSANKITATTNGQADNANTLRKRNGFQVNSPAKPP